MSIIKNISRIREMMILPVIMSGREAEDIKIICVTKSATIDQIKEAISCGITAIAENRVQVASEKFPLLEGVEKHMIGHLQTNKVRRAVELFDVIQSVDSFKLAKEIDKEALNLGKTMRIMIQVNVSDDERFGVAADDALELYRKILGLANIRVIGMMCMAPFVEKEETRPYFRKAAEIAILLNLKELSMGMTNDFEVAIEEGSTMVRIGRGIFGDSG